MLMASGLSDQVIAEQPYRHLEGRPPHGRYGQGNRIWVSVVALVPEIIQTRP